MADNKARQHLLCSTYLTPEPEVLHFGFEVPDIGYLWPILTVENDQKNHFQCPVNIYIMYHSNVSFENDKQGLTVRISLCEGQCRLWFSGCGLQSREYHPQWTSSPNLLAGAYHSAAWRNQMPNTKKMSTDKYWHNKWHLGIKLQKKTRTNNQERA